MNHGFIKVACATPELKVADCKYNAIHITDMINKASDRKVNLCVFPELSLTGYTCGDLFFQKSLLDSAKECLLEIIKKTSGSDIVCIVGIPLALKGKIYNVAAVFQKGTLLGLVPKMNIPNYSEFSEARYFAKCSENCEVSINGQIVPFGSDIIFKCNEIPEFSFGVEICEDLWVGNSPSLKLSESGANIIANLAASTEVIGKADYRRNLISAKSGSTITTYIFADAGIDESTTDLVFSGHNIIAENGTIIGQSSQFENGLLICDTDLQKIESERKRTNTFSGNFNGNIKTVHFSVCPHETILEKQISISPFIPKTNEEISERCEEISKIQAFGLVKRLKHTNCKNVVLGLSGGLDSTLALIVTVNAFKILNFSTENIYTVTMPCFGTTDRTYTNACKLASEYGTTLKEINIKNSVITHFSDIGQNPENHDVTFENSQARERTQILMDYANMKNAVVVGTGDLSELALGWATYNGDHMSMYAVNSSIPKTLVRHIVKYEADRSGDSLKNILYDILDTPVSPELLPPDENGVISQKTEDLVGPYELHDFFIYYAVRYGFKPDKILRMAENAFEGIYDRNTILKWEKIFYRRFFTQQFKRSCMPDGPKVGSVGLSPRGDLKMPSDASFALWLDELDKIN